MTAPFRPPLAKYDMSDRYSRTEGRVFLTGTQALVRILLDQARRDRAAGLKTGGLVSGYRGSPLGALDLEIWRARDRVKESGIEFLPAVNEDLGATAILGSQQVETNPNAQVQGVFGMWYGKGPGVDRSGDALKHGNAYGSSPHGGVLVVAGDDHGCVSSSMPHQSDAAFLAWFMPVISPANVAEFLPFGEWGYALSRFSGLWVGFKAVSDVVESGMSVDLLPDRAFMTPDFTPPKDGLHYRWPDLPGFQIEDRLEAKKQAALAFAEANPIDRVIHGIPRARFGFVTTGKAHLDLMEALRLLGIDRDTCAKLGIDIYKVGMVWPLAHRGALDFVAGKEEILVVEEKRGIVESQLKEYFYDWDGDKPRLMVGKRDEKGERLIPWTGELSPRQLLPIVAQRLDRHFPAGRYPQRAAEILGVQPQVLNIPGATRTPYFCSGCPHNTSTRVPEGSKALAGIGCHFMASWMNRDTTSLIQMGGEGVNWAASSMFTGNDHVFQNLGEGTWYHSGSMAIRQAIAAGANITYKILYNDAVAMTGGQPVDGPVSVQSIAAICRAEGVERIALVSDNIGKFKSADFPAGTTFHDRAALDGVQREIRTVKGVSVLIYEQACATEKRRRRKRGKLEDPQKFVMINELVCEGCGDCSKESNCLSVEPIETEFGPKRRINQSNCNKDYSCLNGFCPSFVTVEGAERLKPKPKASDAIDAALAKLPEPDLPMLEKPYDLLVTGVGGTGVVTVGALISMAAHLEGRGASVLDFTGFAQKFGPVLSFLRLAPKPADIQQVRTDRAAADALIGCDLVVSTAPKASACLRPGTRAVVTLTEMPTGDIVLNRDASLKIPARLRALESAVGGEVGALDAGRLAEALMGDTVYANMILMGFAWQSGLVPVSLAALDRAIELNGVAMEANRRAFALGRLAAVDPAPFSEVLNPKPAEETVEKLITRRAAFLIDYQDAAYAQAYRDRLAPILALGDEELSRAAAKSLFKLMAVKDEYEVARLHRDASFAERIKREFGDGARVNYHLAPPLWPTGTDHRGRPNKRRFPGWGMRPAFAMLARMKGVRGTKWDLFARHPERKMERELLDWYAGLLDRAAAEATGDLPRWRAVLAAPMGIRGYGPVKAEAAGKVQAEVAAKLAAPRRAAA
ncbi:indolepyruvate ferredoxin oxidoreductase family protein [Pararhodobacter sp. SW119]|uniref:indolepyruvate ferredoxin oxidoreductase family protein n=1 Tax=Pararhodobacter sp. SW119 TaxID=2780075 RepID=UPI001ADECEA5|nr:indolepyruvate ferredoxin oxidoreductase family protein [Pararhodobacter sp. SW119]